MIFTLTHPDPAHDHVTCDRCGEGRTVVAGDTRARRAWQTTHTCTRAQEKAA